jgi:excisionase family DNA binding protein
VNEQEFMTAAEVAALFRVTPQCVTKLARTGKLPGIRLGTTWRFNRAEMLRLGTAGAGEGGPDGSRAA